MSAPLRKLVGGGVLFFCPGCKDVHEINSRSTGELWTFNGDLEKPTFAPCILYRSGHFVPDEEGKDCWCTFEERLAEYAGKNHPQCYLCHSFVTGGRIQFLGDSSHELAGRTVDLPPWPHAPGAFGGIEEAA